MAEMHVPVDATFDFDTAIDTSGTAEPGIGGAAGESVVFLVNKVVKDSNYQSHHLHHRNCNL